jgi:hypothetical protein
MLRPVGPQQVSRIGSVTSMLPSCVEVLAPPHHDDLACLGFGGEVVPGQDLVFEGREERLRSGVVEALTG